ncbi:TPA: tRNA (adenosine(37)-N6)-dimethylallyltransferase MiaA, partial [Streptococcus pneumoniae]|nr:tRNA (adenosine(37)-N6)-dimethylallyltransferase MiaA [Streptococcus pneumoniae]
LTWFRNRMQVTFYQIGESGVQDRILSQIEEFLDD